MRFLRHHLYMSEALSIETMHSGGFRATTLCLATFYGGPTRAYRFGGKLPLSPYYVGESYLERWKLQSY
jgi:hypothetical protein